MLSKEPVIDAHEEAKALGLQSHKNDDAAPVAVKKTADKDTRMQRQQSMREQGKIAK